MTLVLHELLRERSLMNDTTKRMFLVLRISRKLFCLLFAFVAVSAVKAAAELPIEIQSTRVVFNEGQPSARITVRNRSNVPYLVAVDITQYCGEGKICPGTEDFMTSPSFKVISPGQMFSFRVVKLAENLPVHRESLYLAHFRLLPSEADLSSTDLENARVTVAMAGSMKLFWRPAALANTPGVLKVRDMLAARCSDHQLEIVNQSAYWGTIGTLVASGQSLLREGPLPMISPFSSLNFPVSACPRSVSISFIAESGLLTSTRSVAVQEKKPE